MNDINIIMQQSKNIKLLYVEDDSVSRDLILMILKELFTDITVAIDGADGLKKFKQNDIDLIITDINMPNMNGFEMIEQIRNIDRDISIVILSAYSETDYFTKGIEHRVDGYLIKPFNMEQFLAILNNVINNIQLKNKVNKLNERLDLALEGGKTAILDWEFTNNDFYISPNWKEMLGFNNSELPNNISTWKKRVHRDDRKSVFSSLKRNLTQQIKYYEKAHRLKHKDGHWIWVLGRAQIQYDDNGKALRMIGTHTNITTEKESEANAVEQHKYLQSIIDGINDPIMVIKEDYTIELMNNALSKNINLSKVADPKHPKCYEISHNSSTPCDGTNHPCPLKDVLSTKKPSVVVHHHYNINGEKYYVELSATPLFDKQNNCIGIIESSRDITAHLETQDELEEQKDILHHQVHHDILTGFPNRILFNDRLKKGIDTSKQNNIKLALFFIDLDHFKEINDSLGHKVGDEVLKIVTQNINSIIGEKDTLARLGGDEFTVIMENVLQEDDALQLAEKILAIINKPMTIDGHMLHISGSIGISLYPNDSKSITELLKFADTAMYKAKDEGRNNFQFYSSEMTEHVFERVVMEASLREAFKNEEFVVYYQSQINTKTNMLIGMEGLVRWQHPTMGMVLPNKFIPLLEKMGLIIELDKWVMKTAMLQVVQWYSQGLNPGVLSLNLVIKHLEQKDFISTLEATIKETGCKAEWLEFEITEEQIMKNPDKTIIILNKLNEMGISLAIDDFGTGYSSLSYLKKFPISKIKIDRSFIRHLPDNEEDAMITKSIIALSKSLNIEVIAEGVETVEQKEFLIKNDCINMQGYFYGRPILADDMKKVIKNR